jgi:hydroxyacylglutathione hydrolase
MIVQTFVVGSFDTNCYVASCETTREAVIIDPGFMSEAEAEYVFEFIGKNTLKIVSILNTHGHPDHTCGNGLAKQKYHVPLLIHESDAKMLGEKGRALAQFIEFTVSSPEADKLIHDGDKLKVGNESLKVIHTPGHSPGSACFLGGMECFSGDTLFAGSIGRTDFPSSSPSDMTHSLEKLRQLSDDVIVYPGHGPKTSIGHEKRSNPFLR